MRENICSTLQEDAAGLLEQLHKYQTAQGSSEDVLKLQSQVAELQVCISVEQVLRIHCWCGAF